MTDFSELRTALEDRLAVVADQALRDRDPAAHLRALQAAAAELDEAIGRLPSGCDPMLRHYLERQSFLKALAWLEQNTTPASQ